MLLRRPRSNWLQHYFGDRLILATASGDVSCLLIGGGSRRERGRRGRV